VKNILLLEGCDETVPLLSTGVLMSWALFTCCKKFSNLIFCLYSLVPEKSKNVTDKICVIYGVKSLQSSWYNTTLSYRKVPAFWRNPLHASSGYKSADKRWYRYKERREGNGATSGPVGKVGLLLFLEDGSDKLF
jgi:hypothetical protein